MENKSRRGLYLHFPFCESKCLYCDFNSQVATEDYYLRWVRLVLQEIQIRCLPDEPFHTLFIGGGTPSIIPLKLLCRLINGLKTYLNISELREFSIEANPSSFNEKSLATYKEQSITRISIGAQSFNDNFLKVLGRIHTAAQAVKSIEKACASGLDVSVDLMFGLPGQKPHQVIDDVNIAVKLPVVHLSLYGLSIEKGTPFFDMEQTNKWEDFNQEFYDEMYFIAGDILNNNGFKRYEVSSFAKAGYECMHNLNYWNHSDYTGIGPGAHSLIDGKRLVGPLDFNEYKSWVEEGCPDSELSVETLNEENLYDESLWLGLRTRNGICLEKLLSECRRVPRESKLRSWSNKGLLKEYRPGCYRLDGRGWAYLDEISADLLSY